MEIVDSEWFAVSYSIAQMGGEIKGLRVQGSGLAHGACCPLITCERGSAGSTGSVGSKGVVRRIKK